MSNGEAKNFFRIFHTYPDEFSKFSSLNLEHLKDLLLEINVESENKETHVDQINTLSLSLELIKIIVFNNFPCNFEGLFKLLIDRVIDTIHIKTARCGAINLLLKLIEEEFISNEKYVENNISTIKKMDIIIDEEYKTQIKELINSIQLICENKIMPSNLSISSNLTQGFFNFQYESYDSILKMSKSENMKFHSKLTNGLFVKMIMKAYKDSNGSKVITKCLLNDFQLPLIISENTKNNYLMEIIENVEMGDDKIDIFNRVDKYFSEIHDILIIVQLIKYFSWDIENLESILSIFLSVVTASYMNLLSSLINKNNLLPLEFLNKFICETSIMFENLDTNKPLVVFGAMNILVFHKFVKVAEKTCPIEYQQLIHSNQDFMSLSRTVLQKLTNLINFTANKSELNWKYDRNISTTSNLRDMLNSSSRNWLCIIFKDNNLKVVLFWLECLNRYTPQLSSPTQVEFADIFNGPEKEYGPFLREILKTYSFLLMNEDPVIQDLITLQFDKQVLQSVLDLAQLFDNFVIINLRESHSSNDLNELTKLFVNFINLLFSSNVINQFHSFDILSIISVKLRKNCVIKESDIPMNLELGPMVLLIIMNVCIQFTNPLLNQQSSISWLKSDIYIKLMWKNMLHSIQQTILNENSKCVDVCQEFFQLFLLIFHGLTSISGKTEIVMDLLNCISFCSSKSGTQPRLLSRLLIILNYLLHHFNKQSSTLASQLQYNLLTKYISEPINVDICHYQYEEVQVFDQKTNGIFYDISVPWSIGKNFWPGSNPDNLILKHMCNNQQYELFFNGVLNAIQICFDHHQAYDEPQKYSLLRFASSFYTFLSNWRLLEIMPLPDKYMSEEHTFQFDNYSMVLNNLFKMKYQFKNLLLTKNFSFQFVRLIAQLSKKMCLQFKDDSEKLGDLPQKIYQIDMLIILINFILQCLKNDLDTTEEGEKSSITLKCFLNKSGIEHNKLFKKIIKIMLRTYEFLILHFQSLLQNHFTEIEFVSFDLSSVIKMASIEPKFDSAVLKSLKSLNDKWEKLQKIDKDSNEMNQFLSLKLFDTKCSNEHEDIIEMIRAESYRRFVFIIDHCKSDQLKQFADSSKLDLSTTMVAIEDLRDLFSLLDNCLSEAPKLSIDCHAKYLDLILLSNINTFIPVNNLPLRSLQSIPNSIYNQVIARKLFNIFSTFNILSFDNDEIYFEVMNQSIDCLINMMDKTCYLSCLEEIVSVFLETTRNESHSNVCAILNTVFNKSSYFPVLDNKCLLLRLINVILLRYKKSKKGCEIRRLFNNIRKEIYNVIRKITTRRNISEIKNMVLYIINNAVFPGEKVDPDFLENGYQFTNLLALTCSDLDN